LYIAAEPQACATASAIKNWTRHVGVPTLVEMHRVWLRKSEDARDFVSVDEIVHVHESSHRGTLGEASSRLPTSTLGTSA